MKITPITSSANPLLKQIRSLHQRSGREKSGLFLIEGSKLLNEAMAKNIAIRDIVVSQSYLKQGLGASNDANISALSVAEDKEFQELVTTDGPCGILGVAEQPKLKSDAIFAGLPLVIIADAIQDPGNLGTMIRTALAACATGMILTRGTVDPYNPKVVRSAAGALFCLPLITDITIEQAVKMVKEKSLQLIACEPLATQPYWSADMSIPTALLFGNEGQGFQAQVLDMADRSVSIPMNKDSESLNVAVSAAIILFRAVEQRLSR